jgi:hypothetical protein
MAEGLSDGLIWGREAADRGPFDLFWPPSEPRFCAYPDFPNSFGRGILRSLKRSKSQPLATDPRYNHSYRSGSETKIWLRGGPMPLGPGLSGRACYVELPRIPLPRTPLNKATMHLAARLQRSNNDKNHPFAVCARSPSSATVRHVGKALMG